MRLKFTCKCDWIIRDEVHSHQVASVQYTAKCHPVVRFDGALSAGPKKCTLRRTSILCTRWAQKSLCFLFGRNINKVNGSVLLVMNPMGLVSLQYSDSDRRLDSASGGQAP